jgi:hypothetical protein
MFGSAGWVSSFATMKPQPKAFACVLLRMNLFSIKSLRYVFSGLVAATVLSASAFAADASGTWKWSATGRNGQAMDVTVKLVAKDGQLTGTMAGMRGETPISDASIKDDAIAFSVVRENNGKKMETKYEGKIAGDTITGKIHAPARGDAEGKVSDWTATRVKE